MIIQIQSCKLNSNHISSFEKNAQGHLLIYMTNGQLYTEKENVQKIEEMLTKAFSGKNPKFLQE